MVGRIADALSAISEAAQDRRPVQGWTHNFYRYPARFSPRFAAAAISSFSRPGELILDPYMGGGTVLVEGMVAGRRVVGNDLNSLAAFIARVKVSPLSSAEATAVRHWAINQVPQFRYSQPREALADFIDPRRTRNLNLNRARFIKKIIAAALATIATLPTLRAKDFARCVVLRVGQWALDGRKRHTSVTAFRDKLVRMAGEMLEALASFARQAKSAGGRATIRCGDAAMLDRVSTFRKGRERPALVVTSPPYPGVHVLYHRWQVDGRRESPAPYWIAGCNDGEGVSFYNFGDRRQAATDDYFRTSLNTLTAIRRVLRNGAYMIQIVAFNGPRDQMPRYLDNMRLAGFTEVCVGSGRRPWRTVPNRKWHAALKGATPSSREVVLVHRAVD